MPTRPTSIAVYKELESNGLLSRSRWAVYQWLYHNGPATGREMEHAMDSVDAHKRLTELRDNGVVREVRVRECKVTGREVIEWDVTSDLPVEITKEKRKSRQELVQEINHLKSLLRRALKYIKTPQGKD